MEPIATKTPKQEHRISFYVEEGKAGDPVYTLTTGFPMIIKMFKFRTEVCDVDMRYTIEVETDGLITQKTGKAANVGVVTFSGMTLNVGDILFVKVVGEGVVNHLNIEILYV